MVYISTEHHKMMNEALRIAKTFNRVYTKVVKELLYWVYMRMSNVCSFTQSSVCPKKYAENLSCGPLLFLSSFFSSFVLG